jgi:hypothetical protein
MRASPTIAEKQKSRGAGIAQSTGSSPSDSRHYWGDESMRDGSNWQGLIGLHFDICNRLQAARVSS